MSIQGSRLDLARSTLVRFNTVIGNKAPVNTSIEVAREVVKTMGDNQDLKWLQENKEYLKANWSEISREYPVSHVAFHILFEKETCEVGCQNFKQDLTKILDNPDEQAQFNSILLLEKEILVSTPVDILEEVLDISLDPDSDVKVEVIKNMITFILKHINKDNYPANHFILKCLSNSPISILTIILDDVVTNKDFKFDYWIHESIPTMTIEEASTIFRYAVKKNDFYTQLQFVKHTIQELEESSSDLLDHLLTTFSESDKPLSSDQFRQLLTETRPDTRNLPEIGVLMLTLHALNQRDANKFSYFSNSLGQVDKDAVVGLEALRETKKLRKKSVEPLNQK